MLIKYRMEWEKFSVWDLGLNGNVVSVTAKESRIAARFIKYLTSTEWNARASACMCVVIWGAFSLSLYLTVMHCGAMGNTEIV